MVLWQRLLSRWYWSAPVNLEPKGGSGCQRSGSGKVLQEALEGWAKETTGAKPLWDSKQITSNHLSSYGHGKQMWHLRARNNKSETEPQMTNGKRRQKPRSKRHGLHWCWSFCLEMSKQLQVFMHYAYSMTLFISFKPIPNSIGFPEKKKLYMYATLTGFQSFSGFLGDCIVLFRMRKSTEREWRRQVPDMCRTLRII